MGNYFVYHKLNIIFINLFGPINIEYALKHMNYMILFQYMKAIDWRKVYKNYKGKWVAVKNDTNPITVVAYGASLKIVLDEAHGKGYKLPLVRQIPRKLKPFLWLPYVYNKI